MRSGSAISLTSAPKALAAPGGSAGLALTQDCGMGYGRGDAHSTGVCGFADGHRLRKSCRLAERAFRPGHAIDQR